MNLSVGIVGLPNVGKSTLFNALLRKQSSFAKASAGQAGLGGIARVGNFAFTTIEPNVGIVPVPDERLQTLAEIVAIEIAGPTDAKALAGKPASDSSPAMLLPPIKPATVEFVDIAGLVKGAAEGAGLGNKFLSHIREVNVIAHVVRAFTDENVIREGSSDPENDYAVIQTELILADLQALGKAKVKMQKSEEQVKMQKLLDKVADSLNTGIPIRDLRLDQDEKTEIAHLFLLTAKQEIVVLNVSEDEYTLVNLERVIEKYADLFQISRNKFVVICAKIESELAELSKEEQKLYLKDLGLAESGLEQLIRVAYKTLGLISFLTAGEKEVRAWTIQKGTSAVDAAGVIHTDFSKNFIKAEVISFEDFVSIGGWKKARELGKTRFEGRDYIVQDGDVIEFKIGS